MIVNAAKEIPGHASASLIPLMNAAFMGYMNITRRRVITMNDRRFFRNLFNSRPHVIKIWPDLLTKFSLNEAVFLNVIDHWITKEYFQNGSTSWPCSSNRLREKFLPFFSRPTIWRIIKDLRDKGVLPPGDLSNRRVIAWTLNYDRIIEILEMNNIDDRVFQSETSQPITKKPAEPFLEPVDNSMRKEKKENSGNTDLLRPLVELFSPRDSLQNETSRLQNETSFVQNETSQGTTLELVQPTICTNSKCLSYSASNHSICQFCNSPMKPSGRAAYVDRRHG